MLQTECRLLFSTYKGLWQDVLTRLAPIFEFSMLVEEPRLSDTLHIRHDKVKLISVHGLTMATIGLVSWPTMASSTLRPSQINPQVDPEIPQTRKGQ